MWTADSRLGAPHVHPGAAGLTQSHCGVWIKVWGSLAMDLIIVLKDYILNGSEALSLSGKTSAFFKVVFSLNISLSGPYTGKNCAFFL